MNTLTSLRSGLSGLCLSLILGACGGGGGGGSSPAAVDSSGASASSTAAASSSSASQASSAGNSSSASSATSGFTLSGTISLPDTAAVDSDTNDALQAGWVSNNTTSTAQTIATPIQLIGTVNVAGTGPSGKTYASGDTNDYFKTDLVAGQVIELSFVSSISSNDIDLYLINAASLSTAGRSISSTSATECIRVGTSGSYYVRINAFKGASLYTLRIGAPGEASTCAITSTGSGQQFVAGQIISKPREGSSSLRGSALHGRHRPAELLAVPGRKALRSLGLTPAGPDSDASQSAAEARLARELDTLAYMKHLQLSGKYEYVEPNYILQQLASYAPTDPYYYAQSWHYAQINQPAAMDRILALSSTPSVRPIVAVIDSGIVSDHPDLASQIVGGYSILSGGGGTNISSPDDPSKQTDSPVWHGTHVAGTIAALDNNAKFGGGVAPMAQLMPLRVFTAAGSTTSYDVSQAIYYAAGLSNSTGSLPARRADVINMSLGGAMSCPAIFQDAITQARAQNVIVVAASGNDAQNASGITAAVSAPANCTGVIATGALDAQKKIAYYSNSGARLSLVAPGGDLKQATTGNGLPDGVFSTVGSFNTSGVRIASFAGMTGTSMASPHVAGVVALMRYVNPALTPAQFDTLLALGRLTDDVGDSGRDDLTGYGLINARKAVDEALALANNASTAPTGTIVASPASISFGSLSTTATLSLQTTAATSEVVTGITSSSAGITITPGSDVNATTRLGSYTLTVNRSQFPIGTSYPTLTVTTSLRSFTVQLTVIRTAVSGSAGNANFGRIWVQVKNADTGAELGKLAFSVSAGKYAWSVPGIPAGKVVIVAGSNLDNDSYFCERGEACGQLPTTTGQSINVSGNLSGLDFAIAPTGTATATSLQSADDADGIPLGTQ